ncbi:MAG TPA: ABC transporter substrate-binding protein [Caldilineaceae bacterium]|nr:ABC transporter substrate-binding protein [Caldilineaceae bacterium]
MPVTVEVTRIVTQPLIIQPTPAPPVPCSPASLEATQTITVGAILPLSLPGAMHAGFQMQTALSLAVKEINDQGGVAGKPLQLVTYDSAGQAERGAVFTERLILQDCAAGIVGFIHSNVALAALEIAHRLGAPMIVAKASADAITASEYPEVFRIAAPTSLLAQMPAQWLAEVGDYNGDGSLLALLIVDGMADTSYVDAILGHFAETGIDAATLTVDLPSTDFSPVIARIVARDLLPDAVFIFVRGPDALTFQAQLLKAGVGPQRSTLIVQQYTGLDSDAFWRAVPDGVGTVVAREGPWRLTASERGKRFAATYTQHTGGWPEGYAFAAYDAVYLLADAMLRAGSLQGPALVIALEDSHLEGAAGQYTFAYSSLNPPGAGVASYMWHQWADVQTLYLQYTTPGQPAAELPVIWPPRHRTSEGPVAR